MEHSYNGFAASRNKSAIGIVPFVVAGVSFPGGVKGGDVHTILSHVVLQVHLRVEPLMKQPGCWGYNYRTNRNANNLSNHSSGTAVDVNAPKHPNGVAVGRTWSDAEIREIHQILNEIPELNRAVRWGGDYRGTPDSMHFEMLTTDAALLKRVVARIQEFYKPVAKPEVDHMQEFRDHVAKMFAEGEVALDHYRKIPLEKRATITKTWAHSLNLALKGLRATYKGVPKS